jgi:hypothetical protein
VASLSCIFAFFGRYKHQYRTLHSIMMFCSPAFHFHLEKRTGDALFDLAASSVGEPKKQNEQE